MELLFNIVNRMKADRIKGVIPPLPTLTDAEGNLDKQAMGSLLDRVINAGVHGVLALGTCGEFYALRRETRQETAEFVVNHVKGRVPVILGIGGTCIDDVLYFGQHAARCGADAVLVINPYYAPLSAESLFHFYQTVAENLALPIMIYNFPQLTGHSISADMVRRLAQQFPSIIGIKDTINNISHIRELMNQVKPHRPDFLIFAGYDEYLLDTLILGGDGGFPASANFAPDVTVKLYEHFCAENYSTVFQQQRDLSRLAQLFSINAPLPDLLKHLLAMTGMYTPDGNGNKTNRLSPEHIAELKDLLPLREEKE